MPDFRNIETKNLNRKEREERKDRAKDFSSGTKEILFASFASSRFKHLWVDNVLTFKRLNVSIDLHESV